MTDQLLKCVCLLKGHEWEGKETLGASGDLLEVTNCTRCGERNIDTKKRYWEVDQEEWLKQNGPFS